MHSSTFALLLLAATRSQAVQHQHHQHHHKRSLLDAKDDEHNKREMEYVCQTEVETVTEVEIVTVWVWPSSSSTLVKTTLSVESSSSKMLSTASSAISTSISAVIPKIPTASTFASSSTTETVASSTLNLNLAALWPSAIPEAFSTTIPSSIPLSFALSSAVESTTSTNQPTVPPQSTSSATSPPPPPTSTPSAPSTSTGKYPFSRVVAFGDSLTDNGNGSYAHCVQSQIGSDCSNTIYGFRTWTDGPVAVSYLVDLLGVPLTQDYAFGWAEGGSKMGATIMSSYDTSGYAQTGQQQIATYLSADLSAIGETMMFLWIGNTDVNLYHLSTASWDNSAFATEMADMTVTLVGQLVDAGAALVFVPGLYAKDISPSWQFLADTPEGQQMLGAAIRGANTAIEAALAAHFGSKVLFYDVYGRMMDIWNEAAAYGITMVGGNFCDGFSQADWDLCVTQGQGSLFYWMQYTDMTTRVHSLIADDMFAAIESAFS